MPAIIQRRECLKSAGDFSNDISPLLQRIFLARDLHCQSDIDLSLTGLLPPSLLKDIDKAVDLLYQAMQRQAKILIVGDFDADGATSCALAIRAFKAFNYNNVQFMVPNRFEYGYGLTPEIVSLAKQLSPQLIVTVDNGISSIEGVSAARDLGIDVLVTDHHLPGRELPRANAIVNPNQLGCEFPSKNLAGVGVIFYVMAALRSHLRDVGWFKDPKLVPNMRQFLDLVALGTVADVVPLDANNRILVQQGLQSIRQGRANAGIRALIEISKRHTATITSSDLGFSVGPRLNAAGRLDDISIGIACLLTDDIQFARELAGELDGLNKDRQQIEKSMQLQAEKNIEKIIADLSNDSALLPTGLCLVDEEWHQGVVGILASRIKERYHRPVICFAPASDDENCDTLKGSARSIAGFHIRDALDAVAAQNPQLIQKFGGHAMAAGLSISKDAFIDFSKAFNQQAQSQLSKQDLQAIVWSDGELNTADMTVSNAALLKSALPWGQKLPEPLFDGVFYVVQQRIVGSNHLKLTLKESKSAAATIDAIAFNIDTKEWPDEQVEKVNIAYLLDVNRFRGAESLQFIVRHIEKHAMHNKGHL